MVGQHKPMGKQKEYSIYVYQIQIGDQFKWIAEFPDIPGIHGTGKTSLEAFKRAYDELQFHLKAMTKNNFAPPVSHDYAILRLDQKKEKEYEE